MEKIEVGYNPIAVTGNLAHHKFILYTRSDGTTFQIHGHGSRDYGWSPFEELASSGPNDLAGFGHLSVRVFRSSPKNEEAALKVQREVVFEGPDLSRKFFKMVGMAQGIAEQNTKYNAGSNNSNTLVDRIAQWSGGNAPRLGEKYVSPGSVNASEFKPELFSKMPPILWGKETYSKHKDVFAGLFGNVGRQAAEPNQNRETGQETPPSLLKNEISPTRLAPTFHEQHKREGRDTVPGNEQKVEDKRGSLDPNALKNANPFDVRKPDLKQQATLLERNPVRAKQVILAVGRDPVMFGF